LADFDALRYDTKSFSAPRVKSIESLMQFAVNAAPMLLPSVFNYVEMVSISGPHLFKFFEVVGSGF
jgi:hypothetical protein